MLWRPQRGRRRRRCYGGHRGGGGGGGAILATGGGGGGGAKPATVAGRGGGGSREWQQRWAPSIQQRRALGAYVWLGARRCALLAGVRHVTGPQRKGPHLSLHIHSVWHQAGTICAWPRLLGCVEGCRSPTPRQLPQ